MITIYHLSTSRSERVIWLMEELGLPYAVERLLREPNLAAPAQLKAIHPLGRAPVIRDGEVVLAESSAVVDYITRRHGGGRLSPDPDSAAFADYLYWLHFAEGTLAGQLLCEWYIDLLAPDADDNPIARRVRQASRDQVAFVEHRLGRAAYFAGDDFTAADIMMAFPFTTMQTFRQLDLSDCPNIRAYVERIGARPAYRTAMAAAANPRTDRSPEAPVDLLPIESALPELGAALADGTSAVLVAPPGAGKTTRVPLVLGRASWAAAGKLILLEPRRLAARAAAERMAATLGERVGETVGLRARFDTRVSTRTRIEVVTEGVFTRLILDDPGLAGVAGVIFDEFHERSLDADLGLALALDARAVLRPDLRLLVMSATLDGARVAGLLGDAPVIRSEGRAFPIVTHYLGRDPAQPLDEAVVQAILRALGSEPGSVLAFLPGQAEIRRVVARLAERLPDGVTLAPLYGALDRADQDRAIAPAPAGHRKVVLATAIAETSLTIEGVRVVVDSGFARVPRFEPDLGLTRLETVRVSRAGADQRRGRAGRTEPGVCYRLWDEAATGALPAFAAPEIGNADLSGLVLDLALWGARDPRALAWLDPPPAPALKEARTVLLALGAIDPDGAITAEGRAIAAIAAPPRVARMVVEAARAGVGQRGAEIAALIVEHGLGGDATDVADRLDRWRRDRSPRADAARGLATAFRRQAEAAVAATPASAAEVSPGAILAMGFPERIAKARGRPGEVLMANGRAAALEPHDRLAREPWLAVGEVVGRAGGARVLLAAPIDLADIAAVAGAAVVETDKVSFDPARAALTRRQTRRYLALVLAERNLPVSGDLAAATVLAEGVAALGIGRLPWTRTLTQWRDRVMFLRRAEREDGDWPDLGDAALGRTAAAWLAPFIVGRTALDAITAEDLGAALQAQMPYELARRLDVEAPTHFEAPTGSRIAVDYEAEGGPVLAIRVQELFGLAVHPALARGRVPLTLHLLSPAHRPVQITRDLPGFWRGSWAAVKQDMKGRYPRHPWPDDPAAASPTSRAKPRGT